MNIEEMKLDDIQTRKAEIVARREAMTAELETAENEVLDALTEEAEQLNDEERALNEREAAIYKAAEERQKELQDVLENGKEVRTFKTEEKEERKIMNRESVEYRDAFYALLQGTATEEQRSTLLTAGTDAIQIPKTLDDKIWDNIHTAHPILDDISIKQTGVILEVNKHTAITAGKAAAVNEGAANATENNTFVKVTLVGQDYSKTVELTYAAAKMSQGALEDYLAEEISADLGEALATAVFAQIKTDLGAAAVTVAANQSLDYKGFANAFGAVARGNNLKVYASRTKKFAQIVGMVDNAKQPVFRDGVTLGAEVREDSAAGEDIFVLDPTKFVLNVVQPVMIESDRDIKNHKIIISGYLRAQGTMRDAGAGAYITFAS